MASCIDFRTLSIILYLNILTVVVVPADRLKTPDTYYALVTSQAELPCVAGNSGVAPRWRAQHEDSELRSRSKSRRDQNDLELLKHVIRNVKVSDAGTFECVQGSEISSTQLVVIEPSPVDNVTATTNVPDEIKLRWKAPADKDRVVRGYNIHVTEVGQAQKGAKTILVEDVSPDGLGEFTLTDFTPGQTYQIQVAPLYVKGVEEVGETAEGPLSSKVLVSPPVFEPVPSKVKAEPWYNSTVLVTWLPSIDAKRLGMRGYIVIYKVIAEKGKKEAQPVEVRVTRPDANNAWSALLKGLKPRQKYNVQVVPVNSRGQKMLDRISQGVMATFEVFNPELSIRAVALSPDTVLVTVDTLASNTIEKLRVLSSDDSAIKWTRLENFNGQEKYAIVTGLQPRSRYFFNAKASVNKKARSVVTHVLTPPAATSAAVRNISVTPRSESSIRVTWEYPGPAPAMGFVVHTDKVGPDGLTSPVNQQVVFKQNEVAVDDLESGQKYQVKVEAFDAESLSACSDPLLFQWNQAPQEEETTPAAEGQAPQFVNEPHEQMQINAGEDIKLMCAAVGSPHPIVQWFQDGSLVGRPADRMNELVLSAVRESTVLTCRASNDFGIIVRQTNIIVTPEIEPEDPQFTESLPETRLVQNGSLIRQWCNATGNPTPRVTWFKNNVEVMAADGAAEFVERSAYRNFDMKCVARNAYGSVNGVTKVYIKELPRQSDYKILLTVVHQTPSQVRVKWAVNEGNLNDIKYFDVECVSSTGNTLFRQRRDILLRSEVLKHLQSQNNSEGKVAHLKPHSTVLVTHATEIFRNEIKDKFKYGAGRLRYTFRVITVTSHGIVDNSSVEFTPASNVPGKGRPVLLLEVNEIRDNRATCEVSTRNIDPRQILYCRVRIYSFGIPYYYLPEKWLPEAPYFLEKLTPNSKYQIIVEATLRNQLPLSAIADFSTSSPGQSGTPVSTSSDVTSQNTSTWTTARASLPFTRKPRPTIVPRTLSITATTAATTAAATTGATTTTATTTEAATTATTTAETTATMTAESTEATTSETTEATTSETTEATTAETTEATTTETTATTTAETTEATTSETTEATTSETTEATTAETTEATTAETTATTTAETTVTTTAETTVTTTQPPVVVTTGANAVKAGSGIEDVAVEEPGKHDYVITTKMTKKTPNSVDIRWTVDRGPLENINNFLLTFKGDKGDILLQQPLDASQRYISIDPLSPNTTYYVNITANGEEGTLAGSEILFQTDPKDAMPDTSRPVLELEATEIRPHTAKIYWNLINAEPDLVKNYKLTLLDSSDANVLEFHPSSSSQTLSLQYLQPNTHYRVILNALGEDKNLLLSSSVVFKTPSLNGYGAPVFNSSRVAPTPRMKSTQMALDNFPKSRTKQLPSQQEVKQMPQDTSNEPSLVLRIQPQGVSTLLTWDMVNVPAGLVAGFNLTVKSDGPQGVKLLNSSLAQHNRGFKVDGLDKNSQYFVELEAISDNGSQVLYAATLYTPGGSSTPYQVISKAQEGGLSQAAQHGGHQNDNSATNDSDPVVDSQEPVITKVKPLGPDTMLVEWHYSPHDPVKARQDIIVKYAERTDKQKGTPKFQNAAAGQPSLVVTNLSPDTRYLFQVAAKAPTRGTHMRWSKPVIGKTIGRN